MNILDSPLEPLAFNYLNFGFLTLVNNLWTWIAVLTAAVSFWRIRAAGCSKPKLLPPSDHRTSDLPDPVQEALMPDDAVTEQPRPSFAPAGVGNGDEDVDGVTKGKFTVYYEDDSQCEHDELLPMTEEWEDDTEGIRSEWWESWNGLLRLRRGKNEKGWYTCQDLTSINGNVVRFWDGGLRFGTFTMESRYSSSCPNAW